MDKLEINEPLEMKFTELLDKIDKLDKLDNREAITELRERMANIEAKLDILVERNIINEAPPKRTRAPAGDRVPCAYKKKDNSLCGKLSRPETEYCADHPEGMTRAAYRKMQQTDGEAAAAPAAKVSTPRLTMEKDEANNLQKIKTPTIFKDIYISIEKPYKAYFRVENDKAKHIPPATLKQLEKSNIIPAPESEQNDIAEQLGLEWEKKKTATTRLQLESDSDSDEEQPIRKKVEAKKSETKAPAPDSDDEEESVAKETKPSKKKPAESDAEVKKPRKQVISDSDSDSDEEETKPSKKESAESDDEPKKPHKNVISDSSDSESESESDDERDQKKKRRPANKSRDKM